MLNKEIPLDLVEIIWDDAEAEAGWEAESEEVESFCHSVGFLVKKTKAAYYVAATVYEDAEGTVMTNNRMRIPIGMVKSFVILQEADK